MTADTTVAVIPAGFTQEDVIAAVLASVDARESTKKTYRYGLRHFLQYCEQKQLTRNTLLEYKQALTADTSLKTATKRLYLNSAKLLFRQLYHQGTLPRDISTTVRGFSVTREHKADPLSEQDVRRVFTFLAEQHDTRLRVMFALLYFQGLRRGEVVKLRIDDFHPNAKTMNVVGKGRDDTESIDLHSHTIDSLTHYIKAANLKSGWLFPSLRSKSGHMSEVQLHRIVQEVHKKLGLAHTVHAWRKAFTSVLIDSGMDLISVSKFTRHKSTQMLDVYYSRVDKKKKLPVYQEAFSKSVDDSNQGTG